MASSDIISRFEQILYTRPKETEISVAACELNVTNFFGWTNKGNKCRQINNEQTAFEIGSVTKVFTSHLYIKLINENKLQLEDKISPWLGFTNNELAGITFKHLLQHTSGLPKMPDNWDKTEGFNQENPLATYHIKDLIHYLQQPVPLLHTPGEKVHYSNLGYALLSYLYQQITNVPYEEALYREITEPLLMTDTHFGITNCKTTLAKALDQHGTHVDYWEAGAMPGALGLLSTTQNLTRYLQYLLSEKSIISAQVKHRIPAKPNVEGCLGWYALINPDKKEIYRINGGSAGFTSSLLLNVTDQKGLAFCSNIAPEPFMEKIEPLLAVLIQ